MVEQRLIGKVQCDFISQKDFIAQLEWWLTTHQLHHVVTLNPEMIMEAEHNDNFRKAVEAADLRVPDGAGLIWARWYLRSAFWSLWASLLSFMFQRAERITGVDAVIELARLCHTRQQKIYLLGGTNSQVTRTAAYLQKKFTDLKIKTSSDHVFSLDGPEKILTDINHFQPDVLLVAYGSPKQTIWIEKNRKNLPGVKVAMGVGGAFAIISEERPRAPHVLRKLNMEWLWRLVLEPSRLPRIWNAAIKFPLLVQAQKNREQVSVG